MTPKIEAKLDLAEILNSKASEAFSKSNAGNELSNLTGKLCKTLSIPLCLTNYVCYETIPIIKDHLVTLVTTLIEKAQKRNKSFSNNPDRELICLALEGMQYNYYKDSDPRIEIFREILFNILTSSEDDNLSDYIRYISLIKNIFPLSLSLIHYIAKHDTILVNTNKNLKENKHDCLFPENKIEIYGFNHGSESELIINNKNFQNFFKYINDLQSIGLITNKQIDEDNNNGKMYEYICGNDEQEKRTAFMKTWKTRTYKYYLLESSQYIYDNFYTDDVKNKIEKQDDFINN